MQFNFFSGKKATDQDQSVSNGVTGQGKEIALSVTERGLYEQGVSIYKNKLSFVREIIQNALDAGATVLSISVSPNMLLFQDNGKGMSRDFIQKEFSQVGFKFKDDAESQRGRYGFGRLSYWALIAKENNDGSISYSGSITIQTGNTVVEWKQIGKYVVKESNEFIDGTRVIIEGAKISGNELKNYLNGILVGGGTSLEVNINGKKVEVSLAPLRVYRYDNSFWYDGDFRQLDYEVGFTHSNELVIAEKGIRIKSIELPFMLGGYVDFKPRGNDTVTTLSREDTKIYDWEIYNAYKEALIRFLSEWKKEDLLNEREKIIKAAEWFISQGRAKPSDFLDVIIVETGEGKLSIRELIKIPNTIWALKSANEEFVKRAVDSGYTVIIIDEDLVPFFAGIPSISDIDLSRSYAVRGIKAEVEKEALKFIENYMPRIQELVNKLQNYQETAFSSVVRGKVISIKSNFDSVTSPQIADKIVKLSEGISIGGVEIYFAELDDPSIEAFEYKGKICFNLTNSEVKSILSRSSENEGALLGLLGIFMHEYVHLLGYSFHNEAFASLYTRLVTEFLVGIGEELENAKASQSAAKQRSEY
ncbi:MAG: ATP-binding protein [Candidatus Micrarchaeia archaeon]